MSSLTVARDRVASRRSSSRVPESASLFSRPAACRVPQARRASARGASPRRRAGVRGQRASRPSGGPAGQQCIPVRHRPSARPAGPPAPAPGAAPGAGAGTGVRIGWRPRCSRLSTLRGHHDARRGVSCHLCAYPRSGRPAALDHTRGTGSSGRRVVRELRHGGAHHGYELGIGVEAAVRPGAARSRHEMNTRYRVHAVEPSAGPTVAGRRHDPRVGAESKGSRRQPGMPANVTGCVERITVHVPTMQSPATGDSSGQGAGRAVGQARPPCPTGACTVAHVSAMAAVGGVSTRFHTVPISRPGPLPPWQPPSSGTDLHPA